MARPSSTSSSEHCPLPGGVPWACIAAVGALIAVEVAVRLTDASLVIPYSVPPFALEPECHAVVDHVDAFGPADICFVGSSRVHQGIVVPEVQQACDEVLSRRVTVANYAISGARAKHGNAIVTYLLKKGRPELILYGVSPRILLGSATRPDAHTALFWSLTDWWSHYRAAPRETVRLLPVVIRHEASKHYLTLRYRRLASTFVNGIIRAMAVAEDKPFLMEDALRRARSSCPMRGEPTQDHELNPDRSLVNHPVPEERLRAFLDRTLQDGQYPMPQAQVDLMDTTIRLCHEHGIRIVLFELPVSDTLFEAFPPHVPGEFRAKIQRVCDANVVPFFTLEKLNLTFTDSDFLEHSHLNYHGALRVTRALIDRVILPAFKANEDRTGP